MKYILIMLLCGLAQIPFIFISKYGVVNAIVLGWCFALAWSSYMEERRFGKD